MAEGESDTKPNLSDEDNERQQRNFFENLVRFWKDYPHLQTYKSLFRTKLHHLAGAREEISYKGYRNFLETNREMKPKQTSSSSSDQPRTSTPGNYTSVPLMSLSNSIQWSKSNNGIQITVRQDSLSAKDGEPIGGCDGPSAASAKPTTLVVDASLSAIPASVLQYQRQLRKVQATQRSTAPLNMHDHFKLLYEDEYMIVVDKPSGVLCVPGMNDKPNLLELIKTKYLAQKTSKNPDACEAVLSKMIVHRLDMDTSGVVVFAKTETTMKALQQKFRDRTPDLVKEYHAILCGHLPSDWQEQQDNGGSSIHIRLPLQRDHKHPPFMRVATLRSEEEARLAVNDLQTHGFKKLVKKRPKPCHTELKVVKQEWLPWSDSGKCDSLPVTRVSLTPHTGRTHQLRVHCAALGYPILGDPAYGLYGEASPMGGLDSSSNYSKPGTELQKSLLGAWPSPKKPMCLHAAKLGMHHPMTGQCMMWEAKTEF
ncbi:MAG: hypothetical protein SGILL_002516 [Bacillariaceae sp.]